MTKITFDRMNITGFKPAQTQEKLPVLIAEPLITDEFKPEVTEQNLETFLQENSALLPPRTAAFGICEDGLSVLFDLTDARTGPVLVVGDRGCGKTSLLQVLLQTAVAFNAPHEVKFVVLSSNPDQFESLAGKGTRSGHCLGVFKDDSPEGEDWVYRASALVERRQTSRQLNPPVLFAVDDFQFITRTSSDVRLNFEWILKHGPSVQVWPVVTLSTEDAARMGRWTSYFHTRMLGRMADGSAERIGVYGGLETAGLEPGQFAVYINDAWLQFHLPKMT